MENIGDKFIIGNPEDINSFKIREILDVYEVSLQDTFFKISEIELKRFVQLKRSEDAKPCPR